MSGLDNWAALGNNIPTDITIRVIDKDAGQTQSQIFKDSSCSFKSCISSWVFWAKDKSDEVLVQDTTKDALKAMLDHVYLKKVDQLHEIVNLAEKPDEESCQSSQPLQSAMADMFPGFDEVSRPLLLRCASFMMENVFNDIKDVANFTSRCSEEGHTSATLKLLNIIKD